MKQSFLSCSKNIDLCLSGGGALGFAHIGVIQALEENGIFPDRIAGTSMGAIVAAFYAAGYSPIELLELIKEHKLYKVSKLLTFSAWRGRKGFSDHTTLRKVMREKIPHNSFEGLNKKLIVCVANLSNGTWKLIDSGNKLDKWVATSASIPGVFETIKHGNMVYTDGSVLNNMPAQPFESNFRKTIGVDVVTYMYLKELTFNGITDVVFTAVRAMQHQNSAEGRDICRYLIEPRLIPQYHEFSFENYIEIYKIGYEATIEFISKNKDILKLAKE